MTLVDHQLTSTTTDPDGQRRAHDVRVTRNLLLVVDTLLLALAVLAAWRMHDAFHLGSSQGGGVSPLLGGAFIVGAWLVLLVWQGAYNPRNFGGGAAEFQAIVAGSLMTAGVVAMLCFLLSLPMSRSFVLISFVLGTFLLLGARSGIRIGIHRQRRRGRLMHRVIAVGGPSGVSEVVDALRQGRSVGYEVVGAAVPSEVAVEPERFPVPVLGETTNIRRLCAEAGADTVLVTRGGFATARELRKVAWDLEDSKVQLVIVPSVNEVAGSRIHVRPVAGLPLLHLERPQAGEAGGLAKRAFDVVGALFVLLCLSPVMLAVAAAIVLQDRGPVFFKQARIGRNGGAFYCLKFRSMFVNADLKEQAMRESAGHEGALWKMEKDPRITRIGGIIRRYSIDELPQLINVLRGDMSLVGPRPQQGWEVETYTDWEHRRLRVRPGMTGLWQVSGRSQLSFDEAIRLDLYYVDNWSMTADLVILAKTVNAVFGKTGAY